MLRKLAFKNVHCDTWRFENYKQKYMKPANEVILDQTMIIENAENIAKEAEEERLRLEAAAAKEAEREAKLQKIKDKATSKPDFEAIEKAEEARKEKIKEIRQTIKPDLNKETEDGKLAGKAYSTGFFTEFEEQSKLKNSEILRSELVLN